MGDLWCLNFIIDDKSIEFQYAYSKSFSHILRNVLNELSEYINNDSGIETICRFLRTKYIPTYDEIILQYGEDIVINNFTNKLVPELNGPNI